MEPTIRDVARVAQTSVSTVSRFLTQKGPVAETTRQRIVEAIRSLGYQPNAVARGLVQKRTGTVGVVIPDVANPFYSEVLRGMSDVAAENQFRLLLLNADLSFEKERDCFALLREQQVDGVIYASGMVTPEHREIFQQLGRPVVLCATYDPDYPFPAVLVDSHIGGVLALEHLIELGHREIAIIRGPQADQIAGRPRWQGYESAAARAGIELRPEWVLEGDFRLESGYDAMARLLAGDRIPTAVAAGSDLMAIGAMGAVLDHGLRVPEDISVVGFDNIAMSGAIRPRLTTVGQPMYDLGARAVSLLSDAIAGQQAPPVEWIQPSLVVRGSTTVYRSR